MSSIKIQPKINQQRRTINLDNSCSKREQYHMKDLNRKNYTVEMRKNYKISRQKNQIKEIQFDMNR